MTTTRARSLAVALMVALLSMAALAQQSDLSIKNAFGTRLQILKAAIDSATTVEAMDSLKPSLDAFEITYARHADFLDKALYPQSYAGSIDELRGLYVLSYDRVYLIHTQGTRIADLETRITLLSSHLDSLTAERDRLFDDVRETRLSNDALREAMKRLTANLQAKDRLIFALVDSIFVPYGNDLAQAADVQKEAISRKIEKANVLARVHDIAADNVRFLEATQLQGKDFASVIDQYNQFRTRWHGLKDKLTAVASAPDAAMGAPGAAPRKGTTTSPSAKMKTTGQAVDSMLVSWQERISAAYWPALMKEFTMHEVPLHPFNDAPGFAAAVRSYVDSMKASGADASKFVNDVWKGRIDKEWRESLSKEGMLGKAEYAALDKHVSDLSSEKFDLKFLLYILIVAVIVGTGWWFIVRRQKSKAEAIAPPPPEA
jgi:hypothetical protein